MRSLLAAITAVVVVGSLTAAGSPRDDGRRPADQPADRPADQLADRLAATATGQHAYTYLRAFEKIADANGGQRSAATSGYRASARYVVGRLTAAGYRAQTQVVPYQQFMFDAEVAQEIAPRARAVQVLMLDRSPSGPQGGITAPLVPAPVKADGTSGCTAEDYNGRTIQGAIVLVPRGSCGYANQQKIIAALGGRAMLIHLNAPDPNYTDRLHVFTPSDFTIPSATVSRAQADQLRADAAAGPISFHLDLRGHLADEKTVNIFAETRGGSPGHVAMAGAHLDSVPFGAGINDNVSSVAALLETAKRLAPFQDRVRNKVRFAFWGAEELIDVGSQYYVDHLSAADTAAIDLYLNFELIASPNFVRFFMDGNPPQPPGSATITQAFEQYFTRAGLPFETESVNNIGSDQFPFMAVGIPVGGMDLGTNGLKTPEQVAKFGGQAGQMYDPCYHQPCDRVANLSRSAFDQNVPAIAWVIGRFAMDTAEVT